MTEIKNKKHILLTLAVLFISIFIFTSAGFGYNTKLPSAVIKLPDNEYAILVEKKTQSFFLISSKDNKTVITMKVPCSTGEVSGKKQITGDKKTPEGVYFIEKKYEEKELGRIYGKRAFPLDYPNMMDKQTGNGGSAIWIHGTNKPLKPRNSNGCIVLENSHILELEQYIQLHSTPVIITEQIHNTTKRKISAYAGDISNMLDQFLDSISLSSYHIYLSFFSDKYLPDINNWWPEWKKIRKTLSDKKLNMTLKRENTGIYYHDNVFTVVFDLFLDINGEKVLLGKRKLFLEKEEYAYKIIADTYQRLGKTFKKQPLSKIMAKAALKAQKLNESKFIRELIQDMIKKWAEAWSEKDMDSYAGFYADNFHSDGMNKKQWLKRKKRIADNNGLITIVVTDIQVIPKKGTVKVKFFQDYKSDSYSSLGTKTLKLIKKDGLWKIYQESWKEK